MSFEEHCLAARGSFTSDDQEYSSYPYVFETNCPDGVTDVDVSRRYNLKGRCHPVQPPFQNQYTLGSHFQDLYRRADCPSCTGEFPGAEAMPNNTCIAVDGQGIPASGPGPAMGEVAPPSGPSPGLGPGPGPTDVPPQAQAVPGLPWAEYIVPLMLLILIALFLRFRG